MTVKMDNALSKDTTRNPGYLLAVLSCVKYCLAEVYTLITCAWIQMLNLSGFRFILKSSQIANKGDALEVQKHFTLEDNRYCHGSNSVIMKMTHIGASLLLGLSAWGGGDGRTEH